MRKNIDTTLFEVAGHPRQFTDVVVLVGNFLPAGILDPGYPAHDGVSIQKTSLMVLLADVVYS